MKRDVFIPEKTVLNQSGLSGLLSEKTTRILQNYEQIARWTGDNKTNTQKTLEQKKLKKVREKRLVWLKEETRFLWTEINHFRSLHSLLMVAEASDRGEHYTDGWPAELREQKWRPCCNALELLIKQVHQLSIPSENDWESSLFDSQDELKTLKGIQFILRLLLKKAKSATKAHSYNQHLSYLNQRHKKIYDRVLKKYYRTGDPDKEPLQWRE